MASLTDKLRREHSAIVEVLNKVSELGIGNKEGVAVLLGAKQLILNHLAREDRELYPALHLAATNNAELRKTIEYFTHDMQAVSRTVLDFFAKYEKGGSGLTFGSDFGKLMAQFTARLHREETRLYILFEKIEHIVIAPPKT